MGRILERIQSFLKEHFEAEGLEPLDDDSLAFQLAVDDGREWGCIALAEEDAEQLMFYSVLTEQAAPARVHEVMRFVTMANYGLPVGNFELDLDDGEVRFKTSIDLENLELTGQVCRNVVELNLMLMELYYDGAIAVIRGERTAAEAIAAIEESEEDSEEDSDDD
ncbi:MAG: YbjN domain-containing protein [Myxococcota bacterium]